MRKLFALSVARRLRLYIIFSIFVLHHGLSWVDSSVGWGV